MSFHEHEYGVTGATVYCTGCNAEWDLPTLMRSQCAKNARRPAPRASQPEAEKSVIPGTPEGPRCQTCGYILALCACVCCEHGQPSRKVCPYCSTCYIDEHGEFIKPPGTPSTPRGSR